MIFTHSVEKKLFAATIGSAALVVAKASEENGESPTKNNPFVPRRLYQETTKLGVDNLNPAEESPMVLKNSKEGSGIRDDQESILVNHNQASSSRTHSDMGILPDHGSEKESNHHHRRHLKVQPHHRRLKPKATKAPTDVPARTPPIPVPTKKPKKPRKPRMQKLCKGSCAPSAIPSALPSESSAPSEAPTPCQEVTLHFELSLDICGCMMTYYADPPENAFFVFDADGIQQAYVKPYLDGVECNNYGLENFNLEISIPGFCAGREYTFTVTDWYGDGIYGDGNGDMMVWQDGVTDPLVNFKFSNGHEASQTFTTGPPPPTPFPTKSAAPSVSSAPSEAPSVSLAPSEAPSPCEQVTLHLELDLDEDGCLRPDGKLPNNDFCIYNADGSLQAYVRPGVDGITCDEDFNLEISLPGFCAGREYTFKATGLGDFHGDGIYNDKTIIVRQDGVTDALLNFQFSDTYDEIRTFTTLAPP